jgi:UDP-glucuronate 4-epimerase
MRSVVLRFFTAYGPRQRPDLAIHSFTRAIWEGRPVQQFGDGSTQRDYTYVDDIVQGVVSSLAYEGPLFDVFNLGESQTVALRDLIALIEKTLGRAATIERKPEQPGDVPVTFADITKARALLGYDPRTKIADGIPKFVDWFLKTKK